MMSIISVGKTAGEFTLKDQNGQEFSLAAFRGKRVLLSFHPLARTSVCSEQMKSLEEHYSRLTALGTTAVGISVDSVPCKKAWADHGGVRNTPLLADSWPHGKVAQQFGTFRDADGISARANILLNGSGKVAFVREYELRTPPDMAEVISVLEGMK
jgi:peroxiredoxin